MRLVVRPDVLEELPHVLRDARLDADLFQRFVVELGVEGEPHPAREHPLDLLLVRTGQGL